MKSKDKLKMQQLEHELETERQTIIYLRELLDRTSTLRCPACGGKLYFSTGYPKGEVMALCENVTVGCHVFYYSLIDIRSQKDLEIKYKDMVGLTKSSVERYRFSLYGIHYF